MKSLVGLHGGTVTFESGGLGKGSKFTVCLPRLVEPPRHQHQHQQEGDQREKRLSNSLRILVVDDNVDAASMLAMLLKASGHQVLVEHGSQRAVERACVEAPEVCLLDIGLPDMDGDELAKRLRSQPETAGSILIAITGYGQEHDRAQSLAAGFHHHLTKPVDTKKLSAILAKIGRA